jgi:hypothetical protein
VLGNLGVAHLIGQRVPAVPGLPLSTGTYSALAALNRVVDPRP